MNPKMSWVLHREEFTVEHLEAFTWPITEGDWPSFGFVFDSLDRAEAKAAQLDQAHHWHITRLVTSVVETIEYKAVD